MTKRDVFQKKALQLIHQKGFKAMTMRDLATEMSCDIKNLYNYTKSKNALLENLLQEISEAFHQGMDKVLNANLTPTQQIEELIRLHVTLSFEKPLNVGLLSNESRNLSEPYLGKFNKQRQAYEDKVESIISAGIKNGEFRKLQTAIVTQSILGSLRWLYNYYYQNDKLNPFDTIEELKKMILPGLQREL